jgi:hypothetical protein
MEDLQIALTTARVDQKNFGLWLKSWQVGQVLQALVTDKAPSGELILRIGGHQITATADIPVQKGAVLMLEVSNLQPIPSLKIINPTVVGANPAINDPLANQLQVLVARQGAVVSPFASLLNPAMNAHLLALLGIRGETLQRLQQLLSRIGTGADPELLRKAVQQSGLFLESQMLGVAARGAPLPEGDIKAMLLRLRDLANRALKQLHGSGKNKSDRAELLQFTSELEGALATITLNQMTACRVDENGSRVWIFDIPFMMGDSVHKFSLTISREGGSNVASDEGQDWKVVLSLNLPKLGGIDAELFVRGSKVSVVIYSELEATAHAMDVQMDALRSGLESRGLNLSVLRCQQGSRGEETAASRWRDCVDEKV